MGMGQKFDTRWIWVWGWVWDSETRPRPAPLSSLSAGIILYR